MYNYSLFLKIGPKMFVDILTLGNAPVLIQDSAKFSVYKQYENIAFNLFKVPKFRPLNK